MNKSDKETPGSFLALTVGIFIGALLVVPMFAYMCRVNGQLRQENQQLRIRDAQHDYLIEQNRELTKSIRYFQI